MTQSGDILMQFDGIIKSEEDKRQYRGLMLKNGLKVLLISDPETDRSAAAMDINVGHMQDPWELPGLAHFCEHMLFLGTEKYPTENDFQMFLSSNGGSSNAHTIADHTNYYFAIPPEHFEGALDSTQSDAWRIAQLERSLGNPKHDFAKFGTGTKETLLENAKAQGLDIREELLKLYSAKYSANLMCFCFLAKESLNDLADMVIDRLTPILNKNVPAQVWTEHPYDDDQVGYWIKVIPVKDLRNLRISFPMPDFREFYLAQPDHYLRHLIGHEGPGSLLSELKRRGWCNGIAAGPAMTARGFGFFYFDADLSEDGMCHVEDIIRLLFQYIALLKTIGPQEWVHREIEELEAIEFRFKDEENPDNYVSRLADALHSYPMEHVLKAAYLMPDFRPDLIEMMSDHLHPKNIVVIVASKSFEGQTTAVEKWYGTKYHLEKIAPKFLEELAQIQLNDYFKLPEKNEFIPTNFELKKLGKPDLPTLIFNNSLHRTWFKQDDDYFLPKSCIFVQLRSPFVYADPLGVNLTSLFTTMLTDQLTEYTYNAFLAGLDYDVKQGKFGIDIVVTGYNEKQAVLLEKIAEKLTTFVPDSQRFEVLKENYVRALKNFKTDQPYQHTIYYTNLLLSERSWTNDELLQETSYLTLENLKSFVTQFLSAIYVEVYVHGNNTKEDALKLADLFIGVLKKHNLAQKTLCPSQLARDREIQLQLGKSYLFQAINEIHLNSAVQIYYQCGMQETRANMILEFFCQILDEPLFDALRTKEQLGYIVHSSARRANGTQGVRIIVQSELDPKFVESRIEAFMLQFKDELKLMPEEAFERYRNALVAARLEKPNMLQGLASKFWSEITSQYYEFDRDNVEVDALKTITKQDLCEFFENKILPNSSNRQTLILHVVSSKLNKSDNLEASVDSSHSDAELVAIREIIDDIDEFKQRHCLYPLKAGKFENLKISV